MKKLNVFLGFLVALVLNSVAQAADYTAVANVTTDLTAAATSATTLFWAFVTLSAAAIIVGILFRLVRKGLR